MDNVYYYCSSEVFLSVVGKKELWLTSLMQSNDSEEGTWMLKDWLFGFNFRDPKQRLMVSGAKILIEGHMTHGLALGVCFSKKADLLSQWRGYAANGSGFAVGFEREALEAMATDEVVLSDIVYSDDYASKQKIRQELSKAFGDDAKRYTESDDGMGSISWDNDAKKLELWSLAVRSLFKVKNAAFREEEECRLHLFQATDEIEGLKYRATQKGVSPYLPLGFATSSVKEVLIGPTNETPKHVVEGLLKPGGFNARVETSRASYRS